MKTTKLLMAMRDRAQKELDELRTKTDLSPIVLVLAHSSEQRLIGALATLDTILEPNLGEWPLDAWFEFLEARLEAMQSMRRAGISVPEMMEILNLHEMQARLILELDKPGTKN